MERRRRVNLRVVKCALGLVLFTAVSPVAAQGLVKSNVAQNGAVVLAEPMELEVFQDNVPLAGELAADSGGCGVWRPRDPFRTDATLFVKPIGGLVDWEPAVVSVSAPELGGESTFSLRLDVERRPRSTGTCCPNTGTATGPDPEEGPSRPELCQITEEVDTLVFQLEVHDAPKGQLLLRVDEWPGGEEPASGFHPAGELNVDVAREQHHAGGELCVRGQAWDLIDDSRSSFEACQTVEPWTPSSFEASVNFSHIRSCDSPPDGYLEEWCGGMTFECRDLADRLAGYHQDAQIQSCENFYSLCDVEPPAGANSVDQVHAPSCSLPTRDGGARRSLSDGASFGFFILLSGALAFRRRQGVLASRLSPR